MLVYTLLADGSSDQVMMPILEWLLARHGVSRLQGRWADLRSLRTSPSGLAARISAAHRLYPCDLLFVHRDAEGVPLETSSRRIPEFIEDFSPLLRLGAFKSLDGDVRKVVRENSWHQPSSNV